MKHQKNYRLELHLSDQVRIKTLNAVDKAKSIEEKIALLKYAYFKLKTYDSRSSFVKEIVEKDINLAKALIQEIA